MEFFRQLFGSGNFQPHGYCYLWNPGLVWLNGVSDVLIAAAYFTIPVTLLVFIRRRRDLPFSWMFGLFGLFIIACGTTHIMEVWNLWHAQYWLAGMVKATTAAASLPTAILLARLVPQAVNIPSATQWLHSTAILQKEIDERRKLDLELRANEARFRETAALLDLTHDAIFVRTLNNDIVFWNRSAEKLYGWSKEEALRNTTHGLLQTVFPKPLEDIEAEVLRQGYWEGELIHRRRDGSTVTVSSRWAPQRDANGNVTAILESNRDLSEKQKTENRFRTFLETAPDAIVVVNHAGEIQIVNSQAEKIFGYPRSEVLGKPVELLVPERFHGVHESHRTAFSGSPRSRAMAEGRELYGRRKNGDEFPVEISLGPIETSGEVLISAVIRDVTERKLHEKKFRESEDQLRLLISSVQDYAILMLDPKGCITTWNAGAERIKGYHAEEILGQHFSKFYPQEDIDQGKPDLKLKTAAELGQIEDEGWRVRKDGTKFWANVIIFAVHDQQGQLRGFGKVTRDMSERKKVMEKLEAQSVEVSRSNARLLEANQELESFSYSVSHDLRAPLRAIDGFSHALLEDFGDKLEGDQKSYLTRIRAATQQMGLLIDDLLNLSRITRSEMHTGNVDLSSIAGSVTNELAQSQPERHVEFQVEPNLQVTADPGLMRVALVNLLSNAWKFTSKRPCARIEVGKAQVDGVPAYFVRDDGAGFDPAYAERLFGAFQRLHSAAEFPGTGVGLATVQRIVHRHGGKLWAVSSVGHGATFYFTLGSPTY